MGIIKAFFDAMGGSLADSWQEVIEADGMSDTTVFCKGVKVRKNDKRGSNKKGTEDVISNGSIIHVYPGQFMMLVDGGKIVDFTAEEGYYKVDNTAAPSLFAGEFGKAFVEAFARVKFGGVPSHSQKAYFINMQEIKGIKFGTRSPVNYFDNFYNSELFLRAHGTYSIKVTNPIKFYTEAIPKNQDIVDIRDINEQYISEFLEALVAAINKMSADGIRISHVASRSRDLSKYMAAELDADWNELRGFEVLSVGIASVSYDEQSRRLIDMRNEGAMLGDATVREGYIQGAMARGIEAAGGNPGGAAGAFIGMGMGMGAGGSAIAAMSEANREQMARDAAKPKTEGWSCSCGNSGNTGKFCTECGAKKPAPEGAWQCPECGRECTGRFCSNCGAKRPEPKEATWFCHECGTECAGKFCTNCGTKRA